MSRFGVGREGSFALLTLGSGRPLLFVSERSLTLLRNRSCSKLSERACQRDLRLLDRAEVDTAGSY